MKRFENLNDHFRDCALTIRRLLRDDPTFGELCEDYEDAAVALDFWQSPPRRSEMLVSEYQKLVFELEAEIEANLRKASLR